jgi:hypothetical protein
MNQLPIEIQNIIWNLYYKDIYSSNIIKELNSIKHDTINFDENIEYIMRLIRCLRFNMPVRVCNSKLIKFNDNNNSFLEKIKTKYSYRKIVTLIDPKINNYYQFYNGDMCGNQNLKYLIENCCSTGAIKNKLVNYWFLNII